MMQSAPSIRTSSMPRYRPLARPDALRPAHDQAIEALAGVVSRNLGPDGAPVNPPMPVADMAGSMTALAAILMALLRRGQTGRGNFIDISMQGATMAWLPNVTKSVFALTGARPG